MAYPRCKICNVPMTGIKTKAPATCSRSICKKKYQDLHGNLLQSSRWAKTADILSAVELAELRELRD